MLSWRRGGQQFNRIKPRLAKVGLQGGQLAPDRSTQEAGIAHLHKSLRENMLEETLKKLLDRKRTLFELSGIGSTILRGDLRTFHGTAIVKSQQAAIADGHPMNIGSQILEGGLTIAKEGASLLTFLTDFSSVSESGIILVAGSADGHAYVPDFTKEECEAYPLIA